MTPEQQQAGLPTPLVVLLIFWLTLLFISFGLFAPRNVTVSVVMTMCAIAVASAIFLILEMAIHWMVSSRFPTRRWSRRWK